MWRVGWVHLTAVLLTTGLLALLCTGCGSSAQSSDVQQAVGSPSPATTAEAANEAVSAAAAGTGMDALHKAAAANKYLFAFFWKAEDESTRARRKVFDAAVTQIAERADAVAVNVTAKAETQIVEKFGLDRAPMPLVLAIAPNGAITGGFPDSFSEQELLDAFASPCLEKVVKALQDRKLTFLCVQNAKTPGNEDSLKGVRDFCADERYRSATQIVMLDPAAKAEAKLLSDLKISADTASAVTVFLAPPGSPIAMFEGATTKEALVETLQKASSACGPGGSCGPGGCGPAK